MPNKEALGNAVVATLHGFSHEGRDWVHLEEVGQVLAPADRLFMLRFTIGERVMDLVKPNRPKDPLELGYAYLPKLYGVAEMLEDQDRIESYFETEPIVRKLYGVVKPWLIHSSAD